MTNREAELFAQQREEINKLREELKIKDEKLIKIVIYAEQAEKLLNEAKPELAKLGIIF